MKTPELAHSHAKRVKNHACRAFTRVELVTVVFVTTVLVAYVLLPDVPRTHHDGPRISCINNLKQLGTAYRIWANDHGDKNPAQVAVADGGWKELAASANAAAFCWTNYSLMSVELGQLPKVLICPSDKRHATSNFANVSNDCISYFTGVDAGSEHPEALLAGDRNVGPGVVPQEDYGYSPPSGAGNDVMVNNTVCWTLKMHSQGNPAAAGNILLGDGSSQQTSSANFRAAWLKPALAAVKAANKTNSPVAIRLLFP